jgi:hemoglobin
MEFLITKYSPGKRPDVELPPTEMLSLLGEEGIRKMVNDHYELIAQSSIRELFPEDEKGFEKAKKNSSDFFVQVCGGPMYFSKNRGKPMLYKRHLPHRITAEAREAWLGCYKSVIEKLDLPEKISKSFWNYLDTFSIWMVNS